MVGGPGGGGMVADRTARLEQGEEAGAGAGVRCGYRGQIIE